MTSKERKKVYLEIAKNLRMKKEQINRCGYICSAMIKMKLDPKNFPELQLFNPETGCLNWFGYGWIIGYKGAKEDFSVEQNQKDRLTALLLMAEMCD